MTETAHLVTREARLLDAAADLLVRWGYQRVTVADVAEHAGIGKGTVYLHFRTKEALFLAVLMRCHTAVTTRMIERMEADPAHALPSRAVRALYREMQDDPVTRTLYLGDAAVLGNLAREAAAVFGGLAERRTEAGREWFGLLRDAGALRTDLPVEGQMRTFAAVTTGYFFVDGTPTVVGPSDPDDRADLLRHTLHHALENPGVVPTPEVAARCAAVHRDLLRHNPPTTG